MIFACLAGGTSAFGDRYDGKPHLTGLESIDATGVYDIKFVLKHSWNCHRASRSELDVKFEPMVFENSDFLA